MTTTKKKPKTVKFEFTIDPYQGFARQAANIVPPDGYKFKEMVRKGTKAQILFKLKDED